MPGGTMQRGVAPPIRTAYSRANLSASAWVDAMNDPAGNSNVLEPVFGATQSFFSLIFLLK
jgi:hypothetical protein